MRRELQIQCLMMLALNFWTFTPAATARKKIALQINFTYAFVSWSGSIPPSKLFFLPGHASKWYSGRSVLLQFVWWRCLLCDFFYLQCISTRVPNNANKNLALEKLVGWKLMCSWGNSGLPRQHYLWCESWVTPLWSFLSVLKLQPKAEE